MKRASEPIKNETQRERNKGEVTAHVVLRAKKAGRSGLSRIARPLTVLDRNCRAALDVYVNYDHRPQTLREFASWAGLGAGDRPSSSVRGILPVCENSDGPSANDYEVRPFRSRSSRSTFGQVRSVVTLASAFSEASRLATPITHST